MANETKLIKKSREQKVIDFINIHRNHVGQFKCPHCEYFFGWTCGGEESNVLFGFMMHLLNQIRVHGSKLHMNTFIEIFGEEEALFRFEIWRLQAIRTAQNLEQKIEELKLKLKELK